MYVATERLYLTKDNKVIREGEPGKVALLVGVGGRLSDEDARRYGLVDAPEEKAVTEPKANKSIGKAPANKKAE